MYFLIDASDAVNDGDLNKMKDFVLSFATGFELGPTGIQMGVWTFGGSYERNIPMNKYSKYNDFLLHLRNNVELVGR